MAIVYHKIIAMLRFLKIFSIFIIIFAITFWLANKYFFANHSKSQSQSNNIDNNLQNVQEDFHWGVVGNYTLGDSFDSFLIQAALTKQLGAQWFRVGVSPQEKNFSTSDQIVRALTESKIEPVMIIGPDLSKMLSRTDYSAIEREAQDLAFKTATHFKGKVHYYQINNEVGSTCLKDNWDGWNPDSYDPQKYAVVSSWLRGANKGIIIADRQAKRIINDQWQHVGIFELLARDGIQYEIIGWDWYHENPDLTKVEYAPGQYRNIPEKLKTFNKEIWFVEANRTHGSYKDAETAQADYIEKIALAAYQSGIFKAFFVHDIIDKPAENLEQDRNWGLVKVKKGPFNGWQVDQPKEAFYRYQKIIQAYPKIPTGGLGWQRPEKMPRIF